MNIDQFTPLEAALTELGQRLAMVRKQQGLSQEELAKAAGIGVATLRRIEGGSDGQFGSWIKVFRALGMIGTVDGLLPEELRSPMAEAKAVRKGSGRRKRKTGERNESIWGDEAP